MNKPLTGSPALLRDALMASNLAKACDGEKLAIQETHLPETFAVAAIPVRHTPLTSDQDRSNCRREENTDHHVAAPVMSTSKPDRLLFEVLAPPHSA